MAKTPHGCFSPKAGESWMAEGLLDARARDAMRSAFVTVNFQEAQKPPATICSHSRNEARFDVKQQADSHQ